MKINKFTTQRQLMTHQTFVSNVLPEKINDVSGKDVIIVSLRLQTQNAKPEQFKLLAFLKNVSGIQRTERFDPIVSGTGLVYFAHPLIRVAHDEELRLQLESDVSVLGDLVYRVM